MLSVTLHCIVMGLLLVAAADTQCGALGAPCASRADCCAQPNGTYCQLNSTFWNNTVPLCASCPPAPNIGSACFGDDDCCGGAPYGFKGWCRTLSPGITFCEQCQPDGGYCSTVFPGVTAAACCSHALSRCNATSGLCYNATGLPPTTLTAAPTTPPPPLSAQAPTSDSTLPVASLVGLAALSLTLLL